MRYSKNTDADKYYALIPVMHRIQTKIKYKEGKPYITLCKLVRLSKLTILIGWLIINLYEK